MQTLSLNQLLRGATCRFILRFDAVPDYVLLFQVLLPKYDVTEPRTCRFQGGPLPQVLTARSGLHFRLGSR